MALTLKAARVGKGLRQEDVARELGVSLNTYNRMEGDDDRIRMVHARKLARMFGMSMDSLFFESDSISDGANDAEEVTSDDDQQ